MARAAATRRCSTGSRTTTRRTATRRCCCATGCSSAAPSASAQYGVEIPWRPPARPRRPTQQLEASEEVARPPATALLARAARRPAPSCDPAEQRRAGCWPSCSTTTAARKADLVGVLLALREVRGGADRATPRRSAASSPPASRGPLPAAGAVADPHARASRPGAQDLRGQFADPFTATTDPTGELDPFTRRVQRRAVATTRGSSRSGARPSTARRAAPRAR